MSEAGDEFLSLFWPTACRGRHIWSRELSVTYVITQVLTRVQAGYQSVPLRRCLSGLHVSFLRVAFSYDLIYMVQLELGQSGHSLCSLIFHTSISQKIIFL